MILKSLTFWDKNWDRNVSAAGPQSIMLTFRKQTRVLQTELILLLFSSSGSRCGMGTGIGENPGHRRITSFEPEKLGAICASLGKRFEERICADEAETIDIIRSFSGSPRVVNCICEMLTARADLIG